MSSCSRYRFLGSILGWFLLAAAATAATPREELLRFVPSDVGFCLLVQDLRTHSASFLASDFVRQFRASPLGQVLTRDAEVQKLAAFEKVLEKYLGIDAARLRDDILGDAVAFAYRPGPPGKPEQEQGLVLLRARDPRLLADLLQRLDKLQRDSGEVKAIHQREHNGRKYVHREEAKGDTYYYLNGPVLVLSPHEAMLRQALECDRLAAADAEPAVLRQLRLLGAERALAALWINPQAFTAEIEWKATQAAAAEAAVLKHFLVYWKALEGVALTAGMARDFEFNLTVRARTEQLPPAARRVLAEASKATELWSRFPDQALLAMAGRLDALALMDMLDGFLTTETRQALHDSLDRNIGAVLGRKGFKEVLAGVGSDLGMCVLAPPAGEKAWFPQTVLALRVRSGDKGAPMDQALLSALHSYAMLAVVGYNRQNKDQMVLKSVRFDKLDIRYLDNAQAFPPGLQPAFALHDGYLVLGSSPQAIRRFSALTPATSTVPAGEIPLLRASLKDLRQYISSHREPLIALAAERNQVSREEARRSVDGLLGVLQQFDRLDLTQRPAEGQVTLTLRLQPVHSARKP